MENFRDRNKFLHTNKYQRQIIKLAVLPTLAFCIVITVFCGRFRLEAVDMMLYGTRSLSLHVIDQWLIFIVIGLWMFFLFMLHQAFQISTELVGAFGRINYELDKIIYGESRQHIKVRSDKDELAKEILLRVNILIDNLPLPPRPLNVR